MLNNLPGRNAIDTLTFKAGKDLTEHLVQCVPQTGEQFCPSPISFFVFSRISEILERAMVHCDSLSPKQGV